MPFSRFGRIEWSVAALAGFSMFGIWASDRAENDAYRWVRHTVEVRRQLLLLERELLTTETGQRGYLITGLDEYLGDYRRGLAATPEHLNRAIELTKDNPGQQRRLCEIRDDMGVKLRTLAQTIDLVRWGEKEKAYEIISNGEGRRAMIAVRASVDECLAEEDQLLIRRETRYTWLGRAFSTVFTLSLLGLCVALYLGIRKYRNG